MRKALIGDVPAMQRLINGYAAKGLMLPRSLHSLYEHLRDYTVAVEDDELVGCVAFHISWNDLAEIRSLAVAERVQGKGAGTRLVAAAMEEQGYSEWILWDPNNTYTVGALQPKKG